MAPQKLAAVAQDIAIVFIATVIFILMASMSLPKKTSPVSDFKKEFYHLIQFRNKEKVYITKIGIN